MTSPAKNKSTKATAARPAAGKTRAADPAAASTASTAVAAVRRARDAIERDNGDLDAFLSVTASQKLANGRV